MDNNTNMNDNSNNTNIQSIPIDGIVSNTPEIQSIPVDGIVSDVSTAPVASIPVEGIVSSGTATSVVATTPVADTPVINNSNDMTTNMLGVENNSALTNPTPVIESQETPTVMNSNTVSSTSNAVFVDSNGQSKFSYCARCGSEFDPKKRYCNKCGNMNPAHPDNANMLKYIKKYGGEGYRIGSGQSLVRKKGVFGRGRGSDIVIGQRTGSAAFCFALNMMIYLVLTIGTTIYYLFMARGNIENVVCSNIIVYYFVYSIIFVYIYSLQLLFIKLNRRWWLSLIPFVNMCVLVEAVNDSTRLMILSLVPGIGQIIWLITIYRLGVCFKKSGLFTLLCPFIMIPIIAFDSSSFHWLYFVSNNSTVEKDYFYKKAFATALIIFVALSFVFDLYNQNVKLVNETGRLDKAYIYNASRIFANDVVDKVNKGNYSCDFNMDEFYFYYDDLSEEYAIPFSIFYNPVEAYIRVEKVKEDGVIVLNEYNYYISVSDGNNGFMEISTKNLSPKKITHYEKVLPNYENGNHCYLDNKKS